ncbi:HK97-gp10 family putative phage morphogenesis protein [Inediibacterium massiliense]|uniref:HK97-gp10 family putative phage morphogenesis protein n=1 Tax=Inediibacterium massiliense TaxID=1658111 RepID=UPI0006B488BA|nr:HK97-gp10 family putative phage morphogenesis protein [Inediibacterium massiliense]
MSDNISFEWDFSGILKEFERMGKDMEKVEKTGTLKASKAVANKLKDNTNRSTVDKEGYKHMQDNIKISGLKEDENLDKYRGVGFGKLQYKANWLNDGTSKMKPTHFLTKTVEETKDEVKEIIDQEIKKELKL